mgnify:CR=1 FL=1
MPKGIPFLIIYAVKEYKRGELSFDNTSNNSNFVRS